MTLHLGVDAESGAALHRQVYEALRGDILSGRLRPGERLPATRALAEGLSVSRATVAAAYDQLQAEGYIEGRHGSGTYVAPNLPGVPAGGQIPVEVRHALPPLSRWGASVAAETWPPVPSPDPFPYDFRPHRVAQDVFPWDVWRTCVDRALVADRTTLGYAPPAGYLPLREAIAEHIREHRAVAGSPDQIVIVNGTQQGLNLLAQLMLDAGDRVAVEDPGYPAARLALEARSLEVARIPVDRDGLRVDRLVQEGPFRLVHVTPSHQDPTGATLSLGRRLALLEEAGRTGCVILEDDYDSEFRYEGRPVESLQGLGHGEHVVYAGTFSKSVLSGLRIGFLVLPPPLVQPFVAAKSLWDSGTPMLEQAALLEFMRSGQFERHIRKMRRLYRSRRDALVGALSSAFGERVEVGVRHGGLNMLITLDVPLSDAELIVRAAEAGVGLRSAAPYYASPPPRPTFLIGFGALPENAIEEGVHRLAGVVAEAIEPTQ